MFTSIILNDTQIRELTGTSKTIASVTDITCTIEGSLFVIAFEPHGLFKHSLISEAYTILYTPVVESRVVRPETTIRMKLQDHSTSTMRWL